jgi:cytoskeletal protein RodZ
MNRLGEALRHEREKKKISLEYIATKTNIALNTLTALENEQFTKIPGGFYFKNYIKSYLNAIDADAGEFLEAHREEIAASGNKRAETSNAYCTKLIYSRFKKKNVFLILLITVAFLGLLFYTVYSKKEAILSSWSGWQKKSVGITIPQSGIDFIAHHFQEDSNRDYSPLNVAIEFSGRCWIQVNRGKEKIIEQTFQKGEKLAVAGYNLTLLLDNPGGVRFLLNGKEVSYFRGLTQPEKITITPATMGKLFE